MKRLYLIVQLIPLVALTLSCSVRLSNIGAVSAKLNISGTEPHNYEACTMDADTDNSFLISNTAAIRMTNITLSALQAPFFLKGGAYPGTGGTCGTELEAGESCSLVISYHPVTSTIDSGFFTVNYNIGQKTFSNSRGLIGRGLKKIVYSNTTDGINSDIFTMDEDGGNKTNITNLTGINDYAFSVSPVTGKIMFESDRNGATADLFVCNPNGSNVINLSNGPYGAVAGKWSPDGRRIVFKAMNVPMGTSELYIINDDGTGLVNITSDPFLDSTHNTDMTWTLQNKILFRSNTAGNNQLIISDLAGNITVLDTQSIINNPIPSPNGNVIIYEVGASNVAEIYSINSDGTGLTNLTNNANADQIKQWSPNGSKIVFSSDRDGNDEIYVMDSDGNNPINVSSYLGTDSYMEMSPDGSKIVFARDGSDIYIVNSDGTSLTRLTNGDIIAPCYFSWSADSQYIALQSYDPVANEWNVFRINITSVETLNLTSGSYYNYRPIWLRR